MNKEIRPEHYAGKIQVIDFAIANNLGFLEGNIVKYVTRYRKKNGLEDLYKALTYLNALIGAVEKEKADESFPVGSDAKP